MNTVLFSHIWMDNPAPGYQCDQGCCCRRLTRFFEHYKHVWPTIVLDNGSEPAICKEYSRAYGCPAPPCWSAEHTFSIVNAQPHLPRGPGVWDYPNVWRAYQYIRDELLPRYEKVIFLATDAYICSQRLVDYIEGLDSGWTALWSRKYQFPATEIQVIVRGCEAFDDFFAGDPQQYNGRCEEVTVPLTHIEKGFVGDRYGEDETPYSPTMDFYTQVSDSLSFDDSQFPVLRRDRAGKVKVISERSTPDAIPAGDGDQIRT